MSGGDDDNWTKEVQKFERDNSDRDAHVTPSADGWTVVRGERGVSRSFRTQRDAIAGARDIIMRDGGGGEISIHGRDGKIRSKSTVKPADGDRKKDGNPPSRK